MMIIMCGKLTVKASLLSFKSMLNLPTLVPEIVWLKLLEEPRHNVKTATTR